ncbi:MAG: helix-turn-helix domain-containing protein [Paracoccus aminovorans]|nr:helix-turn-helix domain-containing protein [Paracoccus aminovorans]
MSRKVATLVYERRVGSSARKAVLAYFADCADDYGRGIWASKKTIADETELGRSTVIRVVNEFVAEGILIMSGHRPCRNGATVNYDMNLDAIRNLPSINASPNPSQSGTSSDRDPSRSGTQPVPERDLMGSQSGTQTVLEPSLNQDDDDSVREPDHFRGKILEAMGLAPEARTALGNPAGMAEARRWLELPHLTEELVCEQIRAVMARKGDGPPHSLAYFTPEMQRASAALEARKAPLAPAPRRRPSGGEAVPMAASSGKVDLDALAGLWVPALTEGRPVPPSAISPRLARHMLDKGLVTAGDLRRAGVTA